MYAPTILAATALATVMVTPVFRRHLVTRWFMPVAARMLPRIGETERIALKAGDVWLDGDLFSGRPDWHKILTTPIQPISEEEQAFIDGPVNVLCGMFTDWDVIQKRDLPDDVWAYLKKEKFFGMIIPKAYGGLGFSNAAHAAVVTRISTRSLTAAVTVMVPNSLGPGELLMRYGTDAQKKHYLPRLAMGEDIPCFGLTEPHAGSDAASGDSVGIVCHGTWQGKKTLGIRLTFNKRYITLAPVATVVGLAFNLEDPDHLLPIQPGHNHGAEEHKKIKKGITLALLPRSTPGLKIGHRHDPMGTPFQNGPVSGTDVFVPLDFIIGGPAYAGHGWRMLMEALSAGRGISLPSLSVGGVQLAARATAAYSTVREQFGLPIGRFEGVRERLARIAGLSYSMTAMRTLTTGGLDAGHHPSVMAAIAKAYLTEGMRTGITDAMDIMAGAAIIRGPNNIFAHPYAAIPIGITVEGANILTRSLIIFGQGSMRCHPYLQTVVEGLEENDLIKFDTALFGHIGHAVKNALRSFGHGLTGGRLIRTPKDPRAKTMRHLTRLSAAFATLTELGLLSLGGDLKRKEYLTGRYSDVLAHLMLASAALRREHDERMVNPAIAAANKPVADYALAVSLHEAEKALAGLVANLPNGFVRGLAGLLAFPLGLRHAAPTDKKVDRAAAALLAPDGLTRAALSADVFLPVATEPGLGQLEDAYNLTVAVAPARAQLAKALKNKQLKKGSISDMVAAAHAVGLLTGAEKDAILKAWEAREKAIQVNAFAPSSYSLQR